MESALSSFLQCRKPCVIVDMDSVAPYLVDTIKNLCFVRWNVFMFHQFDGDSCVKLRTL